MHCPNVVELRVTSSDITDEVTGWVAKCPRLELVELHDNKLVTAVGYAQLLRASPKIRLFRSAFSLLSSPPSLTDAQSSLYMCRSLGRCDVLPQVLSTLYDPQSTYKRLACILTSENDVTVEEKLIKELLIPQISAGGSAAPLPRVGHRRGKEIQSGPNVTPRRSLSVRD